LTCTNVLKRALLKASGETRWCRPFSREVELLDTIPGIDTRAAEMLLAEIG
jgi:hypothetical protein